MIIDCHGHCTTSPPEHEAWREAQVAALRRGEAVPERPRISDEAIRRSISENQLAVQDLRGIGLTLFSGRGGSMGHSLANESANIAWAEACNNLIHRVTLLFPGRFAGVCQLPQAPLTSRAGCVPELRRCVEELGFVGCNLNPDPTDGFWSDLPLTDRHWYPLYEAMVELDVPAKIHVSSSCNKNFHSTGAHYLNGDTTVFMQLLQGDLFKDFPTLRFVIPHGGGAAPYHWGRFRGLAQDMGKPPLAAHLLSNVFFDTCVYHQPGIDLLTTVMPAANILFASETFGAVLGIDPETGHHFDDTKRYVEEAPALSDAERRQIFETNALRVYPRLARYLQEHVR
jgi:4-oxalmesaconate hydratase